MYKIEPREILIGTKSKMEPERYPPLYWITPCDETNMIPLNSIIYRPLPDNRCIMDDYTNFGIRIFYHKFRG
ncbi:unnamed protein product [Rhizophagus irregularis]|nr:unnamed protein product [Rhizophagus irregularis]